MGSSIIYIRKRVWDALSEYRKITGLEEENAEVLEALVLRGLADMKARAGLGGVPSADRTGILEKKFETFSLATIQMFGILKTVHGGNTEAVEAARTAKADLLEAYAEIEKKSK